MSDIKRYDLFVDAKLQAEEGGEWVKWEDYAALQAENERIRKERDKLDFKESCEYKRREQWENACNEARAENERLRKAGDDCEKALCWIVSDAFLLERMPATWAVGIDVAINRWNAAKEVQS